MRDIEVPPGSDLHMASGAADTCFFQYETPPGLRYLFGLPGIKKRYLRADWRHHPMFADYGLDGSIFLRLTIAPMEWSWSVLGSSSFFGIGWDGDDEDVEDVAVVAFSLRGDDPGGAEMIAEQALLIGLGVEGVLQLSLSGVEEIELGFTESPFISLLQNVGKHVGGVKSVIVGMVEFLAKADVADEFVELGFGKSAGAMVAEDVVEVMVRVGLIG